MFDADAEGYDEDKEEDNDDNSPISSQPKILLKDEITNDDRLNNILSANEIERAKLVFQHCKKYDHKGLDEDEFSTALALLGLIEVSSKVKEIFRNAKQDPMLEKTFIIVLKKLRNEILSDNSSSQIVDSAFDALYNGMYPDDINRNDEGKKYILANDFRLLLTTNGEILTDEEADHLIRECNPIYQTDPNDGTIKGLIYVEQYKGLLLDKGN